MSCSTAARTRLSAIPGEASGDEYPLVTYLWDARRLPRSLPRGHVLAVSLAGFALDVTYVGPDAGVQSRYLREEPNGSVLLPLEGAEQPDGCMELSLPVRAIHHLENPFTHESIGASRTPRANRSTSSEPLAAQIPPAGARPGWRIEGPSCSNGRVAGGLPRSGPRLADPPFWPPPDS
jgi:hypothetical protein